MTSLLLDNLVKFHYDLFARWRTVIDLMRSLREEAGLEPTVSSYNVVVEALAKAGEWTKALDVLAEMKENGVRPTEFTYSRCMAGSPTLTLTLKRLTRYLMHAAVA